MSWWSAATHIAQPRAKALPLDRWHAQQLSSFHRAKCDADAGEHRLAQRGSPPCMGRLRSNSTRRVAMIECLRRRDTSTPTPALTPRRGAPYSYSPSPSGAPTHAKRRGLERRRRHRRRAHAVSRRRRAEDMCWNCAPPRNHRVSASAGPLRCRRTPALAHLPVGIPVSPTEGGTMGLSGARTSACLSLPSSSTLNSAKPAGLSKRSNMPVALKRYGVDRFTCGGSRWVDSAMHLCVLR